MNRGWVLGPLRQRMDDFDDEIRKAAPDADLASAIIDRASRPQLLGADGTRHYFVAFITPAELRGAGGFIGNYGELTAVDGRVRLTRSRPDPRARQRRAAGPGVSGGPGRLPPSVRRPPAGRLLPGLTFSPHFPFDADVIEQLYPQSGGERIDGVISIDPMALAALLRFTGPIVVPGLDMPLTSANAADILLASNTSASETTPRGRTCSSRRHGSPSTGSPPATSRLREQLARVLGRWCRSVGSCCTARTSTSSGCSPACMPMARCPPPAATTCWPSPVRTSATTRSTRSCIATSPTTPESTRRPVR